MVSSCKEQEKLYAPACERNTRPILSALARTIDKCANTDSPFTVLEVGSGTGQHAAHFAQALADKNVEWQPSDLPEQHGSICAWIDDVTAGNCFAPLVLDLSKDHWPKQSYNMVFTANTLHIVAWPLVEKFFSGAARCLNSGGLLLAYGPFNYNGCYTSESNQAFDGWLKQRDPQSGIRDLADIQQCAELFELTEDIEMPANNRLLVFRKRC